MPHPLQKLERFALGNVRTRGAQYFAQHRVEIRSIDDDIHAHVIGTRRYEVVVSPQHFDLHAACTCEYFLSEASICKHIWATLLAAYERGVEFVRHATRLTGDESLLDQIDVDTDEVEPPALRNARDAQRQPWQTFFQTLSSRSRHELPRTTTTPDVPEQILYVLDSVRFGGTSAIIYTFGRFAKKSGALGAARKVKLSSSTIAKLPDAEDRELAALLASDYDIAMSEAKLSVLLPRVAATGRLYLSAGGNDLRGPLRLDDRVWQFKVSVDPKSESYLIAGRFVSNGDVIRLEDVDRLIQSGWFVAGDRLARFTSEGSGIWLDALHTHGDVTVPKSAHSQLAAALAASPQTSLEAPPELQIVDVQPSPKLRLTRELGDSWRGEFRVVYGEEEVDPASLKAGSAGGRYIRRRTDIERAMRERLTELNFRGWGGSEVYIQDKDLPKALAALAADDWRIEVGGERLFAEGDLSLEVVSGIDWFDVEGRATFGDRVVEMPRLLAAVRNRESFLSLPGGGVAMIDDEWSSRLQELAASAGQGDTSRLRFARNQATFIDALFAAKGGLSVDRDYENLRKRLQSADAVEPRMEPPGF